VAAWLDFLAGRVTLRMWRPNLPEEKISEEALAQMRANPLRIAVRKDSELWRNLDVAGYDLPQSDGNLTKAQ
jgi:hypothetical protein